MNDILKSLYFGISSPCYLSSPSQLYNTVKTQCKNISINFIKNWLKNQDVHSLHKYIRKGKRSQFVSSEIDRFWATDLVDMQKFQKFNNGIRYLLIVMDILSKYLWCFGLKNKKPGNIIENFNSLFASGRKCKILISDAGKEYDNRSFKAFLTKHDVKLYIMRNTEVKCAPAERVIRTLKEKIMKYLFHEKEKRYINIIQTLVSNYNSTVHSRTKFKPKKVNKSNQYEVFLNLYKERLENKKSLIKKGDRVRILKLKDKFEKGYSNKWSKEIFVVQTKLSTLPYPRFEISDISGNKIIGSFYDFELQKIDSK